MKKVAGCIVVFISVAGRILVQAEDTASIIQIVFTSDTSYGM